MAQSSTQKSDNFKKPTSRIKSPQTSILEYIYNSDEDSDSDYEISEDFSDESLSDYSGEETDSASDYDSEANSSHMDLSHVDDLSGYIARDGTKWFRNNTDPYSDDIDNETFLPNDTEYSKNAVNMEGK